MMDAISTALNGLNAATRKVEDSAGNIARLSEGPDASGAWEDSVDLSEEAVNLIAGEAAFKANVSVIRTAQDMTDELLKSFDAKA